MRPLAIILGWLIVGTWTSSGTAAHAAGPRIEITSVGHEGCLLRGGRAAVLLDCFLGPGESERDSLIRRALGVMMAGKPPFDRVTAALVSHTHDDHFDPTVAGGFLEQHAGAVLAATPDVLAALRKDFAHYPAIKGRLVEVNWGAGRRVSKVLNGVRVDLIKFPHEASQFFPDDVALHIVHINGVNVLHGADAEMLAEQLAALHLESESLDVALLPYSFLATPGADKLFAAHVRAKQVVAMHLPVAGIEEAMATVRKQFPNVIFLTTPFQSIRF